jgi:hypothetical protein
MEYTEIISTLFGYFEGFVPAIYYSGFRVITKRSGKLSWAGPRIGMEEEISIMLSGVTEETIKTLIEPWLGVMAKELPEEVRMRRNRFSPEGYLIYLSTPGETFTERGNNALLRRARDWTGGMDGEISEEHDAPQLRGFYEEEGEDE